MSEKERGHVRSAFEVASQNLRSILRYMHRELQMPREVIELQVRGILQSFYVEDLYEQERLKNGPKS